MPKAPKKQGLPEARRRGGFRQGPAAPRVGLYARVSTHDQQTLPLQLSAMRDHARRRGWSIVMQVEDVGSGARERPKREELIRAARRRELDLILVWRLDRWGRSLVDLITTLQELTELGVGFVSLGEALDLTTPSGRALAGMLAVFAEFERDILRDRVRAGIAQARKEGRPHGRPKTIARHAAEVRRLFEEGLSKREIARRIGISRSSVRSLLGDQPQRGVPLRHFAKIDCPFLSLARYDRFHAGPPDAGHRGEVRDTPTPPG